MTRQILKSKHNDVVKQHKLWDDGDMVKAMKAVISNSMGVSEAAQCYNVPPTTLKNRISGQAKHGTKPGSQHYLTPKEENELAEFLVKACKMGNKKKRNRKLN